MHSKLKKTTKLSLERHTKNQSVWERLSSFISDPSSVSSAEEKIKEYVEKFHRKEVLNEEEKKKQLNLINELMLIYGLKNAYLAKKFDHNKYSSTIANIRNELVKEYECITPSELMLADRIVGSYWRSNKLEGVINRMLEDSDSAFSYTQLDINAIKELNRGIELAHRQLTLAITSLKELKQPNLSLKLRVENAYIAQNQEVINGQGKLLDPNDLGEKV